MPADVNLEGRARLTIDLGALAANYRTLADIGGAAETGAVVKCDAYGLGLGPAAQALAAAGCRTFFVVQGGEGIELRAVLERLQVAADIYVFNGCAPGAENLFADHALHPVLNTQEQVARWRAAAAALGRALPAALHVDTGMNRLGLDEAALEGASRPGGLSGVDLRLIMSHLACGAEPSHPMNMRQKERFDAARARLPEAPASLANSAGVFMGAGFHYDLTRPGIALYGGGPFGRPEPALRPVARLEAPVLQVRRLKAGERVGYGAAFEASADTVIATLGAGYGDGLFRAAGGRAQVWAGGALRPVIGRVSMDSLAVDLGPDGADALREGDMVELIGPNAPLDRAAAAANTISYELLTHLGSRFERRYC